VRRRNAPWTRDEVLAAVKAFHERNGYQPVSSEAGEANQLPTWAAAQRLFGGWNAMIEAAGFVPYPARNSANAKTRAFRDRNPDWREKRFETVKTSQA
jgi:hypothetical protein